MSLLIPKNLINIKDQIQYLKSLLPQLQNEEAEETYIQICKLESLKRGKN